MNAISRLLGAVPLLKPVLPCRVENYKPVESSGQDLIFFNNLGGFTKDGREYVIRIAPGQVTPAPWSNVIANPHFGTVISECGGAYTWGENSQQFRLSPWYNDPVSDASGEAFYIRDEESGQFWSPTTLPAQGKMPYTCRHGFGYSVFEHKEFGIASELWVYVAVDAPVKFCRLVVRNESGVFRRLICDKLRRAGAGRDALQDQRAHSHRNRSQDWEPFLPETRTIRIFPEGWSFWMSTWRSAASPVTGPNSWAETAAWPVLPPYCMSGSQTK